jgi:hypothetical protein
MIETPKISFYFVYSYSEEFLTQPSYEMSMYSNTPSEMIICYMRNVVQRSLRS